MVHSVRFCLAALVVLIAVGPACAQVVINEVLASNRFTNLDEDGDSSDWVELLNAGSTAVDLTGHSLSDDRGEPRKWSFPEASLAPGAYLLVWCSGKDRIAVPEERIVDRFSPLPFVASLISLDDEWRYLTGAPEEEGPPADWKSPDFDDASWKAGRPGFGFGRDDEIRTVLPGGLLAIFLRRTFDYEPGPQNLVLQVRYDDGFVAYLNGVRVASDHFPEDEEPTFASTATRSHSARSAMRFDLTSRKDLLKPGSNLLAIAVLNSSPTSSDLILYPELGTVPAVLHTSFRIDRAGDTVLLVDPAGEIRDQVDLPEQFPDHSYARSPDGSGRFLYHLMPTPAAPNEGPSSTRPLLVADTRFSPDRGFYEEPIEVVITTATEGAEIRYTLDGSTPTESNGLVYDGPVSIDRTTTLRARAFKPGHESTNVDTHTYIFLGDVVRQSLNGAAPAGWPRSSINGQSFDYGMDPNIVDREPWRSQMTTALTQIPSLSLVTDMANLFDSRTGIYVNASRRGRDWERPTSVELINPDGSAGFQVDGGVRIRGGFSRGGFNPKHSFRLFFRSEYGDAKLRFPLFDDEGVDRFDNVDLRTAQNYAWSNDTFNDERRNTFLRDVFTRDLQREQGQPYTRSRYYHLYLNGQYWGLYQTQERSEASYAESYFGPEKEDYDAIKASGGNLEATDGTLAGWNGLMALANRGFASDEQYFAVQGRDPDGVIDPDLPVHVDVDNLIDFMINVFFTGNRDMPVGLGGGVPNNFWAIRNRVGRGGWKFFAHDNEHNMLSPTEDRTNDETVRNNPKFVHQQLDANAEYRLRFADRAHTLFFNGGACTPEASRAQLQSRIDQIDMAIIAESARWGDQHNEPPLTKLTWQAEVNWLMNAFLSRRRDVVFAQLRRRGLYPAVEAPVFDRHGGLVPAGFRVVPRAPEGTIYLTTDGTDPRLLGGAVSPTAIAVDPDGGIIVERSVRVRTRALVDDQWSALNEAVFIVDTDIPLRVTEIMYHPPAPPAGSRHDADEFEFIEIRNVGGEPIDLSEVRLRGGVEFDFASSDVEILDAGEHVVVVENLRAFRSRYDVSNMLVAGEYSGRLSNGGETLVLEGALGEPILDFAYDDAWHPETDGDGRSLVIIDPSGPRESWSDAASWAPSRETGGSPGVDDAHAAGGRQRPGDSDQDGGLSITDATRVLIFLFLEPPGPLPCEGDSIADGGNRLLHDVDASGAVNLTDAVFLLNYLFLGGPPPAGGLECVPIPGCPDACGQ